MYSSSIINGYNDNNQAQTPQEFYNTQSSFSFLLPSPIYIPLEDEAVFCEFFQQQQFFSNDHNHENTIIETNENDRADDHCDSNTPVELENNNSPRKRLCKGDRHSKINTARGPRDRRMRLSLDVAKKLFGLQDLLGFDKASKTVDWLITKSKTAILELLPDRSCSFMDVSNSACSTSECEVLSGTADPASIKSKVKSCCGSSKKQKEKVTRVRKCTDFHHPLAKATREKARERARERTMEKRNFKPILDQDVNQLGSWSTFQENQHQNIGYMSSNFQFNQGVVGDNSSLLMTNNWTPSYLFDYQDTSGITHEHQFADLQINAKSWEGSTI